MVFSYNSNFLKILQMWVVLHGFIHIFFKLLQSLIICCIPIQHFIALGKNENAILLNYRQLFYINIKILYLYFKIFFTTIPIGKQKHNGVVFALRFSSSFNNIYHQSITFGWIHALGINVLKKYHFHFMPCFVSNIISLFV